MKISSPIFNNTNQSAAISIILDPIFKIHPHHPHSIKRIIEL